MRAENDEHLQYYSAVETETVVLVKAIAELEMSVCALCSDVDLRMSILHFYQAYQATERQLAFSFGRSTIRRGSR